MVFLNAGLMPIAGFRAQNYEWNQAVDINIKGCSEHCRCGDALIRRAKSGQVIATSSIAGIRHPAAPLWQDKWFMPILGSAPHRNPPWRAQHPTATIYPAAISTGCWRDHRP